MLKENFLVGSSSYSCTVYSESILKKFNKKTLEVFEKIKLINDKGDKVENYIKGDLIKSGFKRLNS